MATPPLSDEILQAAVAARARHKTLQEAADDIGISWNAMKNRLRLAAERGITASRTSPIPATDAAVMQSYYEEFIASKQDSAKPAINDQFSEYVKIHGQTAAKAEKTATQPFEIPEGHVVKGVSALVDNEGNEVLKWIKTNLDESGVDFFEVLKAALVNGTITKLPEPQTFNEDDLLAVYPIVDLHLGLYAWAPEAGEDYDLTIAANILKSCVANLVARSANASTALILDMGDYFHSDSSRNQTAKSGNALDVDGRRSKIAQVGVELTAEVIDLALQKHDKVIYRKLPGNHDEETSPMLAIALAMRYRDNPRVTVLTEPSRHFMHQHGEVMIAATHGDMLKMGGMAGFMAANWPKVWGATEYRYAYTGHVHHDSVKSGNGVRAESFNTLAAKDAWHAASGYVSQRSAVSITMHKTEGEIDRLTVNLPSFKRAA